MLLCYENDINCFFIQKYDLQIKYKRYVKIKVESN